MVTVSGGPRSKEMTRAERRRRTEKIVKKRINCVNRCDWMSGWIEKPKMQGSCKTKHPFDCGHAKCWLCSSYKIPKHQSTAQEIKNGWKYEEGVGEIN